jgi:hypothetical protein
MWLKLQTQFEELNQLIKPTPPMNKPRINTLVPELCATLAPATLDKAQSVANMALQGVPEAEQALFIKGVIAGSILNYLEWRLEQSGRNFSATLGAHPSRMRGAAFIAPFVKAQGLLKNLPGVNSQTSELAAVIGMEQDSMRTPFNNGFIVGLTYIPPKNNL